MLGIEIGNLIQYQARYWPSATPAPSIQSSYPLYSSAMAPISSPSRILPLPRASSTMAAQARSKEAPLPLRAAAASSFPLFLLHHHTRRLLEPVQTATAARHQRLRRLDSPGISACGGSPPLCPSKTARAVRCSFGSRPSLSTPAGSGDALPLRWWCRSPLPRSGFGAFFLASGS